MVTGRAALCLLAFSSLLSCSETEPARPHDILLVTIDTLRADHLGVYGGSVATPNLDTLARQGAIFENAYASSPLTLPSHSSILTGTYPMFHGVRDNGRYRLPEGIDTLAEILKRAGYRTAAFVGGFPVHSRFGLSQGFDVYDDSFPRAPLRLVLAERRAAEVVASARRFLESDGKTGPVFVWAHLFDPHAPYAPPEPFEKSYAGEVAYVDRELGRLFDGVGDDTLVVVSADHGEGLGEHGERTHSLFVYDATIRVPLLMKGPGIPPRTRVKGLARSIDILPTVLELAGLEGHHELCRDCQGVSLVGGIRDRVLPSASVYAETYFPRLNLGWSELRSLRLEGWKYVAAPEPELYDVSSDPGETRNLVEEHPDKARSLAAALEELEARLAAPESTGAASPLDPETLAVLRSLGYVSSAAPLAHVSLRDPKAALATWERIRSGMELVARGDWERVIQTYAPVVDEEPDLILARSYLAAAFFETGRYEKAAAECAAILEREPSDFEALLLLGRSHARLGHADEAREVLERAASLLSDSPEPWVELAQLRLGAGAQDEAEALLRRAEALDAKSPSVLLLRGKLAMLAGNAAEAERRFRSALEETPLEEDARVQLGNLLLSQRRLDEAEALFREGLRLRPKTSAFHLGLGHSRALAGKMAQAVPELERALELDPSSTLALNSLGFAYLESGRTQEGAELLRRSLKLDPNQPAIETLLKDLG